MPAYDAKLTAHLRDLYADQRRAHAFHGTTRQAHAQWAGEARPALDELVGLTRMRDELAAFEPAVSIGTPEDLGGYTRQRCVLHSEPAFDVPFWYVRPEGEGPFPLALFPHGHIKEHGLDYAVGIAHTSAMREKIDTEDRDVALQAMERGFAGIAPATRGFLPTCVTDANKRHGDRNCRSHFMHALIAGRTAVAERVWDMMRLIDWAADRPEIDTSTVLMMGNSGGGVTTLYAAACDERVSVAVASCSFCTYVSTDGLIHHCDCNAVPGVMRFGEFHDVAGLIAPRPLLIVHGREDPLFPFDEIERGVTALRGIYDAADASGALGHAYGHAGHRFYKDLMWPFIDNVLGAQST